MRACALLVAAALTLASPRSARAQDVIAPLRDSVAHTQDSVAHTQDSVALTRDSITPQRHGWITGPLVGLPGAGSEALFPAMTLGYGVTRLAPNEPGLDFSIGTAPYGLAFGVIPVGARLGGSIPVALGRDAFLIPSAGVSAVALAGEAASPPVVGWYWGAAAVVAHGPVGLRAGVTWHRAPHSEPAPWLVEVGVMHVPLPSRMH